MRLSKEHRSAVADTEGVHSAIVSPFCRRNILHKYTMLFSPLIKLLAPPFPGYVNVNVLMQFLDSQTVTAEDEDLITVGMVQGIVRSMVGI